MHDAQRITTTSWLMIALLALIWGGTFLVTEIALRGITPFWLAAARIVFATLVMVVVWGVRGFPLFASPPATGDLVALVLIGALSGAVPFSLLAWGQQHVTSGFAGVSMAAIALIVLPLAHFFVPGERLNTRKVIGFLLGFAGVCLLIGSRAFESSGTALELPGRLACIAAAACYAVSSILMRRLPAVDTIGLAAILLVIGATLILPAAWAVEGPPPLPDRNTLFVLAFLGLVPTAAANLLRVTVVRSAGPVFMSLVNYQVPVWSVVLGALLLSEPLPPALIGAMALLLAGVALSQFGAPRRLFGR
mgnify:CR=1 FL=1